MTPLMAAARGGHTRVCELLLEEATIDISKVDQYGRSALIIAASQGKTETCRLLTMHGADINSQSSTGITGLMAAIDSTNQECVKFFLDDQHANVLLKNSNGANALSFAAKRGYVSICKSLLQRGISVESTNNRGTTALMMAANNGHLAVCRLLLENGADARRKNCDHADSIDCAATQVVGKFLLRWIGEEIDEFYSDSEHSSTFTETDGQANQHDEGKFAENEITSNDEELARKLQEQFDKEDAEGVLKEVGETVNEISAGRKVEENINTNLAMEEKSDAITGSSDESEKPSVKYAAELGCSIEETADIVRKKMQDISTERSKLSENFLKALQNEEVADDLEHKLKAFYQVCEQRDGDVSIVNSVEKEKSLSPQISKELQAFICPITQDVMSDPVTCMDGHTYEKAAIKKWLLDHDTSPLTGAKLPSKHLIPNFALRSAIDEAGIWSKK